MRALVVLAIILAFCCVLAFANAIRHRRIANSRRGEDMTTFLSLLHDESLPYDVAHIVYHRMQKYINSEAEFPVHPEDNLYSIFGIVDEDVDDLIVEVLAECGRRMPPNAFESPPRTVRDVLDIIKICPTI
jgi:hypothetical protein